ncbi:MAG: thioredoxin domain-containing protein [bacterium]
MNEFNVSLITCPICNTTSRVFKDKATDRIFCPSCQFPLDSGLPIPLDDVTISKFIEMAKKPVMILFWAPWEKESEEVFELLALELEMPDNRMILASVDIGKNPESKRRYGIEMIPTIVIMSFGREINRIVGVVRRFELSRLIQQDRF